MAAIDRSFRVTDGVKVNDTSVIDNTGVWIGPTTNIRGPQGAQGAVGAQGRQGAVPLRICSTSATDLDLGIPRQTLHSHLVT